MLLIKSVTFLLTLISAREIHDFVKYINMYIYKTTVLNMNFLLQVGLVVAKKGVELKLTLSYSYYQDLGASHSPILL